MQERVGVQGESLVTRDEDRMTQAHASFLQRSDGTDLSHNVASGQIPPVPASSSAIHTPKKQYACSNTHSYLVQMQKMESSVTEKCTEVHSGMTPSILEVKRWEMRREIRAKMQEKQKLKQEREQLLASVENRIAKLFVELQKYQVQPAILVSQFQKEFEMYSVQISKLDENIKKLNQELTALHLALEMEFPIRISVPHRDKRRIESTSQGIPNLPVYADFSEANTSRYVRIGTAIPRQPGTLSNEQRSVNPADSLIFGIPESINKYSVLEQEDQSSQNFPIDADSDDEKTENVGLRNPREIKDYWKRIFVNTHSSQMSNIEDEYTISNQEFQAKVYPSSEFVQWRAKFNDQIKHLGKETVHPIPGIVVEDTSVESARSGARQPENDISQAGKQQKFSAIISTKEWNPKQPPTFHGKCKEDVCRWIG